MSPDEGSFYLNSLLLYFNKDDRLIDSTFRKMTYFGKEEKRVVSYPLLINSIINSGKLNVRSYTFKKFERLNSFLVGIDKVGGFIDDET
jgi:hypothetical protein